MPGDHIGQSRAAYGESAHRYAVAVGTSISPAFEARIDRAMLATFVELIRDSNGTVVDAGCGTGRVARHLADAGLDVIGVDVAPGMIAQARAAHPDIEFDVAELARLPFDSESLSGIAYWYSIITTPPDLLGDIWSELRRTLGPRGVVLVAFQCGSGDRAHRPNAFGTTSDLTLFHHDLDHVRSGLESVGLEIHASARRRPCFAHEAADQAFIVATASY